MLHALTDALGAPATASGPVTLRLQPSGPVARIEGLHVDMPGRPELASATRVELALPWGALFGQRGLRAIAVRGLDLHLVRDRTGGDNWPAAHPGRGHPLSIGRVDVPDGRIRFEDAATGESFIGTLTTAGGTRVEVEGDGRSSAGPWRAQMSTPVQADRGVRPFDLRLALQGSDGPSTAHLSGRLAPRATPSLTGALEAAGPDLHELSPVVRIPLPHTPPYRLNAAVTRGGGVTTLGRITATVGRSDLSGRLEVTLQPNARRIDADLRSSSLRMADLLDVASSGQLTRGPRKPGGLLPDGRINLTPLRKLFGQVRLHASHMQSPGMRSLDMTVLFDGGRISTAPLAIALAQGREEVRFTLDGRPAVPAMRLALALQGVSLQDFHPPDAKLPFSLAFDASAHLQGAGASLAAAAGASSGEVQMAARDGRMQILPATLLSADLARGLIALLAGRGPTVAIRCGVADFAVSDGRAQARRLSLVTDAGAIGGEGSMDLRAETAALVFHPVSPNPRLTAVSLDGPLAHPHVGLQLASPGHAASAVLGLAAAGAKRLVGAAPPTTPASGASDCRP